MKNKKNPTTDISENIVEDRVPDFIIKNLLLVVST